ncbi:hypothetical protein D0Y65_034340 [Glycine soja]|uniref:Reverse transcriptase domain-containing protein n=1 Tax=Glycine soja TaxID=3848 RepID=A0A445HQ10_GLYSO|nr:hypothetical protein D0Y65_034340 [Glycine soja]
MAPYMAPGVNGFQPIFYQSYWHIISDGVWRLVNKAFYTGSIPPKLDETLIVPVLKVDNPTSFRGFRSINLCNVIFNVICKVLVNRMRPHLGSIIGPLQSSFIPNGGTFDNAMITHYMHKKKGKYIGFTMLSGRVTSQDFAYVMNRINSKLAGWKGHCLNKAGMVTLAKSVLATSYTYTMQNLWFPEGICEEIDSIVRKLFLERYLQKEKCMLAPKVWSIIHEPHHLGVQMLKLFKILKVYGFCINVGNGEISLFFDKFMDDGPITQLIDYVHISCGRNVFQDYFDDVKESRVKQSIKQRFKNQVSSFKIQDSRIIKIKIQDSRFKNQEKAQSR